MGLQFGDLTDLHWQRLFSDDCINGNKQQMAKFILFLSQFHLSALPVCDVDHLTYLARTHAHIEARSWVLTQALLSPVSYWVTPESLSNTGSAAMRIYYRRRSWARCSGLIDRSENFDESDYWPLRARPLARRSEECRATRRRWINSQRALIRWENLLFKTLRTNVYHLLSPGQVSVISPNNIGWQMGSVLCCLTIFFPGQETFWLKMFVNIDHCGLFDV